MGYAFDDHISQFETGWISPRLDLRGFNSPGGPSPKNQGKRPTYRPNDHPKVTAMSKYDTLLAVESPENTEPATSPTIHDEQTREEIQLKNARAKFPEPVSAGDAYNVVCGTEWLLNRLAKSVDGKGAKQQVGRLAMRTRRAKREIQDDFRALNQGDLRTYKLAHPVPTTIKAREITDDEIRALGITDQYSDRLFVGADFKLPKLLKDEILGETPAEPVAEPEPEPADTCNGLYLSGKKAGAPCTAEAKDHGFCLRHQQQAEIETDEMMFAEPEPEPEPEPTSEPKTTDTTTGTTDAEMAKAEAISAAAEAIKMAAEALKNLE